MAVATNSSCGDDGDGGDNDDYDYGGSSDSSSSGGDIIILLNILRIIVMCRAVLYKPYNCDIYLCSGKHV